MLHRSEGETDPSLWGIPAGKVEPGEDDVTAALREVYEETGITLATDGVHHLGELVIEYDGITVVFPMFSALFDDEPTVTLDPAEHIEYAWMTVGRALATPNLMKDVDKILLEFCVNKLGMPQE